MLRPMLIAICLAGTGAFGWISGAAAQEAAGLPSRSIYAFGDSLTGTENIFALSGEVEPPSPPYFNGRYSDGPVWVEYLAENLGIDVDLQTPVTIDPLAHNQAVGGAFTDTRNADQDTFPDAAGTGILGQVAAFKAAGGKIRRRDLVVIWGGANNYLFDPIPDVATTVGDLAQAVEELADVGGRRFIIPNLPNLGDTPLGSIVLTPIEKLLLNLIVRAHNTELAAAMAQLREDLGVRIVLLDVNTAFRIIMANPAAVGLENVTEPCLIQNPDLSRTPTGVCPEDGDTYDATGVMFWDLVHPTTALHSILAIFTQIALAAEAPRPAAEAM